MAAFTHPPTDFRGGRFNRDFGMYCCALDESMAVAESCFHWARFLQESRIEQTALDMRVLRAILSATALHDLRQLTGHDIMDPFFEPYKVWQRALFHRCLSIVNELYSIADWEVHYRFHENKPSNVELESDAPRRFGQIIPDGLSLTVNCWRERDGGENFHARYLLTEKGGVRVDAGFDPVGDHQTKDMALIEYRLCQMRLATAPQDAVDYELVQPVLRISSIGEVKHV